MRILPSLGDLWHRHAALGVKTETLARLLYYAELYKQVISVPGVICEFGVQWGATLVALTNLRAMFEPYNHGRQIIGFDTFEGFPSIDAKDGSFSQIGDYASVEGHMQALGELLELHEATAPLAHIKKHSLVKGDISSTFPFWLDENPHALISMAIFDTDLYRPTVDVLRIILPRLTKGSLLVFDELSCPPFPGETVAVREVLGTETLRLRRSPLQPFCSWAVWGD